MIMIMTIWIKLIKLSKFELKKYKIQDNLVQPFVQLCEDIYQTVNIFKDDNTNDNNNDNNDINN